eukprot:JP436280.1.p2 GENE.JP436280.1~~JP436280.1.p2  ORF type:complete len:90 (+),score=5.84 JP436280.1:497-766(+)
MLKGVISATIITATRNIRAASLQYCLRRVENVFLGDVFVIVARLAETFSCESSKREATKCVQIIKNPKNKKKNKTTTFNDALMAEYRLR